MSLIGKQELIIMSFAGIVILIKEFLIRLAWVNTIHGYSVQRFPANTTTVFSTASV